MGKYKYTADVKPFQPEYNQITFEIRGDYYPWYGYWDEMFYESVMCGDALLREEIFKHNIISWEYTDNKLNTL